MITLAIGLFIGAFIGFILAAVIACGRSAEDSSPSPLGQFPAIPPPFTPHHPNQNQPSLPLRPSMGFASGFVAIDRI